MKVGATQKELMEEKEKKIPKSNSEEGSKTITIVKEISHKQLFIHK